MSENTEGAIKLLSRQLNDLEIKVAALTKKNIELENRIYRLESNHLAYLFGG